MISIQDIEQLSDQDKFNLIEKLLQHTKTPSTLFSDYVYLHTVCVKNMNECVCLLHATDNTILYTNSKFSTLFGYSSEELHNYHFKQLLTDADYKKIAANIVKTGQWVGEVCCVKKSGDSFWCRVNISPVFYGDNDKALCTIFEDITETKEKEKQLLYNFQLFKQLVENSYDICWMREANGKVLYLSPDFKEKWGIDPKSVYENTDNWMKPIHPEDLSRVEKAYQMSGKHGFDESYRIILPNGSVKYIHAREFQVKNKKNHIDRYAGFATDVTQQNKLINELRDNEELYRQIPENVKEVFWVTDKNLNITYVSPWCEEVWGVTAEQLKVDPQGWAKCIHPDDSERVFVAYKNILNHDFDEEFRIIRPDGTIRYIHDRAFRLYDEDGELYQLVGVALDLTEKKLIESKLHIKRNKLSMFSKFAILGETTTTIAHELNQPLTCIVQYIGGCLERLKKEKVSKEIICIMEQASREAERAGEIIHGIRNSLKKSEARKTEADIKNIIDDTLHLLEYEIARENIELDLKIDTKLPRIKVDVIQIEQVIMNLILNAIEAMHSTEKNTRKLTIKTKRKNDNSFDIIFSDTGPGFDINLKDEIFRPFFTTKEYGMGMGLSISRSIIENHGGNIYADSRLGLGSTLTANLPYLIENINSRKEYFREKLSKEGAEIG